MKYTEKIPNGAFIYVQASGGIRAGAEGTQAYLDLLELGVKVSKDDKGNIKLEGFGNLGPKVGAELWLGLQGKVGLTGNSFVEIAADGSTITWGMSGGGAGGIEGSLEGGEGITGGGKIGVGGSATGGYKVTMTTERYTQLSWFERSMLGSPPGQAWLAWKYDDVTLSLTTDVSINFGAGGKISGGGGFGPGGSIEGGGGMEWDIFPDFIENYLDNEWQLFRLYGPDAVRMAALYSDQAWPAA